MKYLYYLFDLDGVLSDTSNIHNMSTLEAFYKIKGYNLPDNFNNLIKSTITTKAKLEALRDTNIINDEDIEAIYDLKKNISDSKFNNLKKDNEKVKLFEYLKLNKCFISVVTNTNKKSAELILRNIGIFDYIDILITNNDVTNKKPHSEPYIRAISHFGATLEKYIIFEDSEIGLQSAYGTGAFVYKVNNLKEVNINTINNINDITNINILIPMAGLGSRFVERGFKKIKPLIEIDGVPMIKKAIDSLNINGNYIFILRSNENIKELKNYLLDYKPNCKIVDVNYLTEGSASSCYLAKELINNDNELLIANCDQYLEWDSNNFLKNTRERNLDCSLLTYESDDVKNSFIKMDAKNEKAIQIREKENISNNALVGVHYFKKGKYFTESYEEIYENKTKFKNEYYVSTVCDNMIQKNYNVGHFKLNRSEKWRYI